MTLLLVRPEQGFKKLTMQELLQRFIFLAKNLVDFLLAQILGLIVFAGEILDLPGKGVEMIDGSGDEIFIDLLEIVVGRFFIFLLGSCFLFSCCGEGVDPSQGETGRSPAPSERRPMARLQRNMTAGTDVRLQLLSKGLTRMAPSIVRFRCFGSFHPRRER